MPTLQLTIPDKLQFLLEPHRHKVAYGGRGGAKTHTFAMVLMARAYSDRVKIFCGREIQKSIDDSVYSEIRQIISDFGLYDQFDFIQSKIRCKRTGSEFLFGGLRSNITSKKSLQGIDIFWGEEAQDFSQATLDIMEPTIRKPGSEMWWSFNPLLEEDPIYQMFVMNNHPDAYVQKINYYDNPWHGEIIANQAKLMKMTNSVKYRNVWLGECKQAVDGAIFAEEMELAKEQKRITTVPIERGIPVNTYWDLGRSDNTAIWFAQLVGMEWRILDYYEQNGQHFSHFIEELDNRGYRYGTHFLPHDASNEQLAANRTIEEQLCDALEDNPDLGDDVQVVPRVSRKHLAIDAARGIFSRCFFDSEKTKDGLQCLRRYRYDIDEQSGRVGKDPKHDIYSHGADAFLTLAQSANAQTQKKVTLREFYA